MEILKEMITNNGKSLSELNSKTPVLLVFLRHFGCVFCREALDEISVIKPKIQEKGFLLVFVHMSDEVHANLYFERFNLQNCLHICDPTMQFYERFGLKKASYRKLIGFQNFIKGFNGAVVKGYGLKYGDTLLGDVKQMPGVFLILNDKIIRSFIHNNTYDKPDYLSFLEL